MCSINGTNRVQLDGIPAFLGNLHVVGPAYVYLLRCGDGSLYCGWTVDLERRVAAHGAGRASRYTRSRAPVSLAAAWSTPDRSTARRLEVRVKALRREAKEALVAGAELDGAERVQYDVDSANG
jgi:putative endonuclease